MEGDSMRNEVDENRLIVPIVVFAAIGGWCLIGRFAAWVLGL